MVADINFASFVKKPQEQLTSNDIDNIGFQLTHMGELGYAVNIGDVQQSITKLQLVAANTETPQVAIRAVVAVTSAFTSNDFWLRVPDAGELLLGVCQQHIDFAKKQDFDSEHYHTTIEALKLFAANHDLKANVKRTGIDASYQECLTSAQMLVADYGQEKVFQCTWQRGQGSGHGNHNHPKYTDSGMVKLDLE